MKKIRFLFFFVLLAPSLKAILLQASSDSAVTAIPLDRYNQNLVIVATKAREATNAPAPAQSLPRLIEFIAHEKQLFTLCGHHTVLRGAIKLETRGQATFYKLTDKAALFEYSGNKPSHYKNSCKSHGRFHWHSFSSDEPFMVRFHHKPEHDSGTPLFPGKNAVSGQFPMAPGGGFPGTDDLFKPHRPYFYGIFQKGFEIHFFIDFLRQFSFFHQQPDPQDYQRVTIELRSQNALPVRLYTSREQMVSFIEDFQQTGQWQLFFVWLKGELSGRHFMINRLLGIQDTAPDHLIALNPDLFQDIARQLNDILHIVAGDWRFNLILELNWLSSRFPLVQLPTTAPEQQEKITFRAATSINTSAQPTGTSHRDMRLFGKNRGDDDKLPPEEDFHTPHDRTCLLCDDKPCRLKASTSNVLSTRVTTVYVQFESLMKELDGFLEKPPTEENLLLINGLLNKIADIEKLPEEYKATFELRKSKIIKIFDLFLASKTDDILRWFKAKGQQKLTGMFQTENSLIVMDRVLNDIQAIFGSFGNTMQLILNDVCASLFLYTHKDRQLSDLTGKLKNASSSVIPSEKSQNPIINEILNAAGMINNRHKSGKTPAWGLINNFIARLESALKDSQTPKDHLYSEEVKNALNIINEEKAVKLSTFGDNLSKDNFLIFIAAIVNARFHPEYAGTQNDLQPEIKILGWNNDEFLEFLNKFRNDSTVFSRNFSFEWQTKISSLIDNKDAKKLKQFQEQFNQMLIDYLEDTHRYGSHEFNTNEFYLYTMVKYAAGEKMFLNIGFRRVILLLSKLSNSYRRTVVHRFLGENNNIDIDSLLQKMENPAILDVKVSFHSKPNLISFSFLGRQGKVLETIILPVMFDGGVPVESMATSFLLLFGHKDAINFHTHLRYYKPPAVTDRQATNSQGGSGFLSWYKALFPAAKK